jgi:hypothetical protein
LASSDWLDGAIRQPLNRSFNEIAGCFKHFEGPPTGVFTVGAVICFANGLMSRDQKLTLRY